MKLTTAIKIVYMGKYQTLDVKHYIGRYFWNPYEDRDFQSYKSARYLIHKHPLLENTLKLFHIL
jgi:hypothetical protein